MSEDHGHSHGLVDDSIKRSREGVRAVLISLAVLGLAAHSPALVADGDHARADAYVSLAVIASAAVVAIGLPIADPIIGLALTLVILRITWQSWATVRGHHVHH